MLSRHSTVCTNSPYTKHILKYINIYIYNIVTLIHHYRLLHIQFTKLDSELLKAMIVKNEELRNVWYRETTDIHTHSIAIMRLRLCN